MRLIARVARWARCGTFAALALAGSGPAVGAEMPVEDFFRDYAFDEVRVSPDGRNVAVLSVWKEHRNLYVIDLNTKRPTQLTGLTDMHVAGVRWVGSKRLIFTTEKEGYLTGGLFAIDVDGKRPRTLGESVYQQGARGSFVFRGIEFLDYFGRADDRILVTSNERTEFETDVYVMNVHNGAKRRTARNPGGVRSWLADSTGTVRVGFGEEGRQRFVIYRETDDAEWREIRRDDFMDGHIVPLRFASGDRSCYVLSTVGEDRASIRMFDPKSGELGEALFAHEIYDADHVMTSGVDRRLLGFAFEAERSERIWVDEGLQRLQAMVDEAIPGSQNIFYSRSVDERWIVILAMNDRDPGTFYLLDSLELTLEKLVSRADWIRPDRMAEMRPISYRARDGLVIHGYLTVPLGSAGKGLPLIVNPHGGPWLRDSWGFDREAQFLASRGYAVLKMNFRGSTGYGRKHLQSGYGQWGLAMQDDITDGVHWAIEQGIADPRRIAIYGASYGGYATMAGLAFTPDLYRCGVNYVGVTDIDLLLRTVPRAWKVLFMEQLESMTGDRKLDRERLEATSPLRNAERIKAPVFFAYGELDDRVDPKHGSRLAAALRRNGVPVEWMSRSDEGHGFRRFENKVVFYRTMERFLAEHMK
jgi:dipeptidyl aminopeptidase/acylaminoacyl peptidase